jgi:hypothetical protein
MRREHPFLYVALHKRRDYPRSPQIGQGSGVTAGSAKAA